MQGLQFQPIRMNSDALGTLAADTAIVLNNTLSTGLTQSFLVKQIELKLRFSSSAEGNIIVGVCNGTATVAEIASAMRDSVTNPGDASSPQIAAQKSIIWWETLRMMASSNNGLNEQPVLNETIKIGGGKGIPMKEGNGTQIFAWNPASAALTDGFLHGLVVFKGVWLND